MPELEINYLLFTVYCLLFTVYCLLLFTVLPNPTFHFDAGADPDPDPHHLWCKSATTGLNLQTLQGYILSLFASIVSIHGPP